MLLTVFGALIIGLTLGLLGSGGSILTVPVLVYLLGHEDKVAVAESLAIVGGISLVAMVPYARAKQVPAPIILGGLPIRLDVGTSLVVIALKSLSGFAKYLGVLESLGTGVDWQTIGAFAAIGIAGSLLGNLIGSRLNQQALRWGFAGFLLVMSGYILSREIPHLVDGATDSTPVISTASATPTRGA